MDSIRTDYYPQPPSFQSVKKVTERLYAEKTKVLDALQRLVQNESCLVDSFADIRKALKRADIQKYGTFRKRFYTELVKSVMPDETFVTGGDRRSEHFQRAKQQAIVEFVEEKAKAAPENADEDAVVANCIDAVAKRWSPTVVVGDKNR